MTIDIEQLREALMSVVSEYDKENNGRSRNLSTKSAEAYAEEIYAHAKELEAKLAKAVEALRFYGGVMPVSFLPAQDGGGKARTTLAELKGGKDE